MYTSVDCDVTRIAICKSGAKAREQDCLVVVKEPSWQRARVDQQGSAADDVRDWRVILIYEVPLL